jgi:hypothetical protein
VSIDFDYLRDEHKATATRIILNKIAYYNCELVKFQPVDDRQYDSFEVRYLQLCMYLGLPNTLVHKIYNTMVWRLGPSGQLITINVPEELDGKGMFEVDYELPEVQEVLGVVKGVNQYNIWDLLKEKDLI